MTTLPYQNDAAAKEGFALFPKAYSCVSKTVRVHFPNLSQSNSCFKEKRAKPKPQQHVGQFKLWVAKEFPKRVPKDEFPDFSRDPKKQEKPPKST